MTPKRIVLGVVLCAPALLAQFGSLMILNMPANSIMKHGLGTSYTDRAFNSTPGTHHLIALSNLSAGAAYELDIQQTSRTSRAKTPDNASISSIGMEIAGDMMGNDEAPPEGVPSSYDWADGPAMWMGNNPGGWQAITSWGVVFVGAQGNPATNTRVNIRDLRLYVLQQSTGQWLLLQDTSQPDGADYLDDFANDTNQPGDVRQEPDGTISVTAGGGWCFHFYPQDRASIDPNDVGGVIAIFQARLIVGDPNLPDDRSTANYLCGAGADYYPALTGSWPGDLSYNPGVGAGKLKYVRSYWRTYSMTTMTADQLNLNPPPVNRDRP